MKYLLTAAFALAASPALAAGDVFFSLANTDFVVLLAFLLFLGVLVYFKVPGMLTKMLDERADSIRKEIDEAKALREEAQSLLASYERKQKDVQAQADRIVENARAEANSAAEQAKTDIQTSVARRLAAAEEQIASAQDAAVRDVRNQAVTVAVAAAREVIAKQMSAADANRLIDEGISEAAAKLH
ncbi:ATP synthase F0, B subunit [Oceanicola granulosus HTCC2516]|uniref:ATP synthase subunit b n=1 Tax=Oceanicola granulosus (strain ATCC BAA-861 / DSM 15982 / KCTC 12143 / HTCC2516) TaxID=314256 RepID=Q2CDQ5_OCEGH|nr:F0F1 ATP synthase subunit B [Oceanicola granulosus]EAR50795.1 ATP synthase F0, B subunit [Oceanicola granulosus HTCC2516]